MKSVDEYGVSFRLHFVKVLLITDPLVASRSRELTASRVQPKPNLLLHPLHCLHDLHRFVALRVFPVYFVERANRAIARGEYQQILTPRLIQIRDSVRDQKIASGIVD